MVLRRVTSLPQEQDVQDEREQCGHQGPSGKEDEQWADAS